MITVKMVIGLLAFEERVESLMRRGFIIVPRGTTYMMFFQPSGIQVFDEIKSCGLSFLALVVLPEVEITVNLQKFMAVFYTWTIT